MESKMLVKIKRALISVSDKSYLDVLAKKLSEQGVEIISSGGTRNYILGLGIDVTPIEKVTGNPEAFGGRMKTLSFQVSSSLLFRRNNESDIKQAKELGIDAIDLVVCNLYPFEETARKKASLSDLIENIDIGGPTMVRAAAKNYESVCICTNPSQYKLLLENLEKNEGSTELSLRKKLSLEAFRHTASYDSLIASELEKENGEELRTITLSPANTTTLRYGENPHQKGWVVKSPLGEGLAQATPIQGKELSYNNLLDADAAYRATCDLNFLCKAPFDSSVVIIKHSNPCGVALSSSPKRALELAWSGDPVSSFGSIICFNKEVDKGCAEFLSSRFVEVIIAPSFSKEALGLFAEKKNLRLIPLAPNMGYQSEYMVRSISGGFIVQSEDSGLDENFKVVTKNSFGEKQQNMAHFATMVTKHLKSNAIALFKEVTDGFMLVGAGMGNPNRLVSISQALAKAKENNITDLSDAILVSDAFFPFSDNIDATSGAGIKFIIQPGGSIKDKEVIEAADKTGTAMIFSGRRHFRH
jgi:phosphoribosylaminoimidazolecarboxamide formyltransferase / IMP cyclohydrolase